MDSDVFHLPKQDTAAAQSPVAEPAPHMLHVHADRPIDVNFSFEHPQSRVGIGASVLSHLAMALVVFLVVRYVPDNPISAAVEQTAPKEIVWLSDPGPGGGGGGGGNKSVEPPKKAELPGKDKITVPVVKTPVVKPDPPKAEPPPLENLNIPAKTMASAEMPLPGAIQSESTSTTSQGAGTGGGAGTGTGSGIGSGQGSGLGAGTGGGTGGGAYRPGAGITIPSVIREVKPQYTADAMRAKVQGQVWLECIVMPDGSVGDIKVIRSLDSTFGLDQEAMKAARQWRFRPGTRMGEPVPVIITIELTFSLR
ncbi:MAG TPA: energy transducer TonB [Vicinamibacterales bacterium]|nr:energy transducer TonB [Vicinamibacterales bacterium]